MTYDSEQFHLDVEARLLSLSRISTVTILREQPGVTDEDVLNALQTLNERAGKSGACVLIPLVEENVQDKDTPGPQLLLKLTLQVITDALVNLNPEKGTMLSNGFIRRAVRRGLHHWSPNNSNVVYCTTNAGVPMRNIPEGLVGYELDFEMPLPDEIEQKVSVPRILGDASAVSFRSATVGTTVYYTTDGSFPWEGNPTAIRFGVTIQDEDGGPILSETEEEIIIAQPFSVAPGTHLRVAAYLPSASGMPGSDVAVKTF